MVFNIADNILSPLGATTEQNYQAVMAGRSALCHYANHPYLPAPFTASMFSEEQSRQMLIGGLSRFESMVATSAKEALSKTNINPSSPKVLFVLSTTKADIESSPSGASPSDSALRICQHLGIATQPLVVCNACISGLSAIILAKRLLETHAYDFAIVSGADTLNPFILSGFQSLRALAENECRPFDMERIGMNLGEAAATMVLSTTQSGKWSVGSGAIRNDAYHISTPTKQADGAYLSLRAAMQGNSADDLAFINAHGTATLFNDQMESVAIERALGTNHPLPVNALKGYFGHTLGAAGILETVISMRALDDGIILGTRGFEERGVSGNIHLSASHLHTEKKNFLKMISGFGGCNAALWVGGEHQAPLSSSPPVPPKGGEGSSNAKEASPTGGGLVGASLSPQGESEGALGASIVVTPEGITLNGKNVEVSGRGKDMLTDAYKRYIGDYPKFYKMDMLSRLGFVAAELLVGVPLSSQPPFSSSPPVPPKGGEGSPNAKEASPTGGGLVGASLSPQGESEGASEEVSIILFNHSSSVVTDRAYYETIRDKDNYFPSPSLFVYTLPNIVTAEIAIRHHCRGETTFCILPKKDSLLMRQIQRAAMQDTNTRRLLTGWIDCEDENHFEAQLEIIESKKEES